MESARALPTTSDGEAQLVEQRPSAVGRITAGIAFLAVGAACVVGVAAMTGIHSDELYRSDGLRRQHLTVRSLLESPEVADVATDNIMTYQPEANRARVHGRVLAGLAEIGSEIQAQDPESHTKMAALSLTTAQKDSAMRALKKYSDSRMVGLTHKISAAVLETKELGGDSKMLARKLSEHLSPSLTDLKALHQEIFPGEELKLDVPSKSWNAEFQVDMGRRLAAENGDVRAQAHTLFKGLERELGDAMPKAPARMLMSSTSTTTAGGDQGFMDCLIAAVPSPTKVVSCITSNMSEVVKMVTDFMSGKK
jgi:hypothetical protein